MEEAFKAIPEMAPRIRVFVEVKYLNQQFSIMLDKVKHQMNIDSFIKEICTKVNLPIMSSQ